MRLALAFLALLLTVPALGAPRVLVPDRDDLEVAEDVVLAPGTFTVPDANGDGVLRVVADGVTVDLGDAVLAGSPDGTPDEERAGWGIVVEGRKGVTIRGGAVRGFKVAVRARGCEGLRIEGVDVSANYRQRLGSTPEREDSSDWLWPHENDEQEWETRYGAGVSLVDCPGAVVVGCRARAGQNGLLLTRCDGAAVLRNDLSFLSGWGLAMWRSSRCVVVRNRLDWCVRGYSHGVYDRGQDSAGILVFEQCSDNLFACNSATHGGDGFFLYAGHETTRRTGRGGCNGNVLFRNDFSHAVANGIEATFSEGNLFLENRLDDCNYGVWAGYSRKTIVRGNVMRGCSVAGVAIEHGTDNAIEGNVVERCRTGVQLWWDEDPDLTGGVYGKEQDTSSSRTALRLNRIVDCPTGVFLGRTTATRVLGNEILGGRAAVRLKDDCAGFVLEGNVVLVEAEPNVVNETGGRLALGPNLWLAPPSGEDLAVDPAEPARPETGRWRDLPAEWPFLPPGARRGREWILVDDHGPYDFREPRLWPAVVEGGGEATLRLLGNGEPFEVLTVPDGVAVSPRAGRAPASLELRADAGAYREGRVAVRVGDRTLEAVVHLLPAEWTVRYFAWAEDPRADPAAFARLVEGEPLDTQRTAALDLRWQGGRPTPKVPADRFATVAETTVTLPAGVYEIVTVSDDGVRVIVDGETALENWTWHGPTEDRAKVTLAGGPHRIRVEHFEIDGWAVLSLRVRPIRNR